MNIGLASLLTLIGIILAVFLVIKVTNNLLRTVITLVGIVFVVMMIWVTLSTNTQQEILEFLKMIKDQMVIILSKCFNLIKDGAVAV